jgi:glutathione synthase
MHIGFVVNDIERELAHYTTTLLAQRGRDRGYQISYLELDDFTLREDDDLRVVARFVPDEVATSSQAEYLNALFEHAAARDLSVDDLDVLFLRYDPSIDSDDRPWAERIGVTFGQMAAHRGVLVVNDPFALAGALNKMYFQYFPAEIRPETLISRDRRVLREFVDAHPGGVVVKPLVGSGGKSVFLARHDDRANINQMIAAVARDGYVVAQEYLPAGREGDVRMFLLEGRPLQRDGEYAAIRRVGAEGDLRSNIHAGGRAEAVTVDTTMLRIAEMIGPKLRADGIFLAGIDIVGDHLLEVNVFSPGTLTMAEQLRGVPFGDSILDALERRVEARRRGADTARPTLH